MSISSEINKVTYTGDNSTASFPFNFPILDETHLQVSLNGTVKTLTTHYTVSGTGNDFGDTNYKSGIVTFVTTPATDDELIIRRDVPLTQLTNYVEADAFTPDMYEEAIDKLTMLIQRLKTDLDNSLVVVLDNSVTLGEASTPTAGYVLARNLTNTGYTWVEKTDVVTSSDLTEVLDDLTPQLGGNLDVNSNSIVSVSNGNITITPNGTGSIVLDGLNWPQADGTTNYLLKTNGSGQLGWVIQVSDTGIDNIVEDTTPQLGGDLDVNGNSITSASNGDINISPNGTGTTNIKAGGTTRVDITSSGLRLNASNARVTTILDEDNMVSNSATALATQHSIKAYTTTAIAVNSGHVQKVAKFWINMTGTGTIAINDSYNVSGIVDNGVGDYAITIDSDFSNSSYFVSVTSGASTVNTEGYTSFVYTSTGLSTGSVPIQAYESASAASIQDAPQLYVIGFGDR